MLYDSPGNSTNAPPAGRAGWRPQPTAALTSGMGARSAGVPLADILAFVVHVVPTTLPGNRRGTFQRLRGQSSHPSPTKVVNPHHQHQRLRESSQPTAPTPSKASTHRGAEPVSSSMQTRSHVQEKNWHQDGSCPTGPHPQCPRLDTWGASLAPGTCTPKQAPTCLGSPGSPAPPGSHNSLLHSPGTPSNRGQPLT